MCYTCVYAKILIKKIFTDFLRAEFQNLISALKGVAAILQIGTFFGVIYERKKCEIFFYIFIFNKSVHSCKRLYF